MTSPTNCITSVVMSKYRADLTGRTLHFVAWIISSAKPHAVNLAPVWPFVRPWLSAKHPHHSVCMASLCDASFLFKLCRLKAGTRHLFFFFSACVVKKRCSVPKKQDASISQFGCLTVTKSPQSTCFQLDYFSLPDTCRNTKYSSLSPSKWNYASTL